MNKNMNYHLWVSNLCFLAFGLCWPVAMQAKGDKDQTPPYKNPAIPLEQRVDDLLGRMTLEEKVLQLNQYTLGLNNNENNQGEVKEIPAEIGSVIYFDQDPALRNSLQQRAMTESRLGIPVIFGYDVIHGFRTVFPIPLAQSCSWNPELVKESCSVAARESRASGVDWTFSPMLDVARDPRWGRVSEGYGEDPYATGVYATAAVKGYQGDDLTDPRNVAACLKHYVGYGASEAGLDYVYSEISRLTLWNTYLPPFEEGVRAGVTTLMSGFNDISGTPATNNHYTLTEVLRHKWNYKGFVVSDWTAVEQLVNQGVAANRREAAEKAFMAGVDMDIIDNCYRDHLPELVREGRVPIARIDDAVRRILRLKFALGLFEQPYVKELPRQKRVLFPEYRQVADRLAEESTVLLKNENGLLPLSEKKNIALIGPMVTNQEDLLGWWWGQGMAEDVCPIMEAVKQEFKNKAQVKYAEGCDIEGTHREGIAQAVETARQADVVVVCLGEIRRWSGENAPMASISLPAVQEELLAEVKKAGKPIVLALSAGRPLDLSRLEPLADAIVMMWQPGIAGGKPLAGILSGKVNPSGKLSITFPRTAAQIPIYYNRRPASRYAPLGHYRDMPSTPLYEFGHGLSYTTYEYGKLQVPSLVLNKTDVLTLEIPVTNTSDREGMETVMWFINDPVCTVSRPVKELKYFEKQTLRPGETRTFRFQLNPWQDLSYRDENGNRILEAGDYYVMVKDQRVKLTLKD